MSQHTKKRSENQAQSLLKQGVVSSGPPHQASIPLANVYNQPHYQGNMQKQRQVNYSPFSQQQPHATSTGQKGNLNSQVGGQFNGAQQQANGKGMGGGGYSSSQQQQMLMMMQQLQKQGNSNSGQGMNGSGNAQFSLGAQLPQHNRSESAAAQHTPTPSGGLDRQMIEFVAAKHHNISVQHDRKTSGTPQPMNAGVPQSLSAFNKKKKSHQVPSSSSNMPGGFGSIIIGTSTGSGSKDGSHLLMFGQNQVGFSQQKRQQLSDSERRRQQANMGVIKKGTYSSNEEKQRSIRSANNSPTTHHFLMNGLAAAAVQNSHQAGPNLLQDILPAPQTNSLLVPRPQTSNHVEQQHSNSNTSKSSPNNQSKMLHQRPKTSIKAEAPNYYQSSTPMTQVSTNMPPQGGSSMAAPRSHTSQGNAHQFLGAGQHHHSKSVGDDSQSNLKRALKKNGTGNSSKTNVLGSLIPTPGQSSLNPKAVTRPSSGHKKRPTQGPVGTSSNYDQQSQQQMMMMLLLQQQQTKVKSISDSHRAVSQQKINNFVDSSLGPGQPQEKMGQVQHSVSLSNQELQALKQPGAGHVKVNQSTDFATLQHNKMTLNSKFQSAPSTPTKLQGKVVKMMSSIEGEGEQIKPQLIERNVITKYAFATRVGFIPNNPNKVNQDSFILSPNLNGCNFRHYFGVCDGHGQMGKEASHFIKLRLPQLVGKYIDDLLMSQNQQNEGSQAPPKLSPTFEEYKQIFHKCFIQCNEELDQQTFDVNLSGSTVCTVIFNGTKVYCANAGDSRAIKVAFTGGQHEQGGSLTRKKPMIEATALNRDHKPELKDEAERILKRGGRIDSFRDYYNNGEPIGPQRVWLMNEEIPGLAMSRSMGDKVAHSVGVTAEPDTLEFTLTLNDKFLVIASDGVWEFLSNDDVANIVFPFYEQNAPEAAANALVKAAFKKWKQEEEVIDDITVVIIFLEVSMAYNSLRASIKSSGTGAQNQNNRASN